ncbi:MAG: nucleotidyltransferase domain-containing protein [Clostridia bacterium]|nr:nucleotidyltransferase domain-containing protein [Clostridia bacterium]MDD4047676.1 nucleotidyltransferase domain-containing protein [Clostridia bacterium]
MDTAVSKELETIMQAILDIINVSEIYLFGSYAYGTHHNDSDFDIYVVIPDDSMRPIEAMQKIGGAISRKNIRAVDIIVGKASVFNKLKQLPTIERTIFRDGVKIYGQEQHSKIMV